MSWRKPDRKLRVFGAAVDSGSLEPFQARVAPCVDVIVEKERARRTGSLWGTEDRVREGQLGKMSPALSSGAAPPPSRTDLEISLFGLRLPVQACFFSIPLPHRVEKQASIPMGETPFSPRGMWLSPVTQIRQAKTVAHLYKIDAFPQDVIIPPLNHVFIYSRGTESKCSRAGIYSPNAYNGQGWEKAKAGSQKFNTGRLLG